PNIPEFGTVQNEDEFHWLLAMSSYHHVRDGIKYPPTLITHGANDTRVELWQSLKMAARLQTATASEAPILLRVDYGSGHGRGSSSDQRKNLDADIYAFVLNLGKIHR
ncbi:MAG: prolyl oligopeptidase family serine peptidase, partial [Verrucomicrobiota bacterium]